MSVYLPTHIYIQYNFHSILLQIIHHSSLEMVLQIGEILWCGIISGTQIR